MPLLGQKIYLAKAEKNRSKKRKGKFEIPFTNEVFSSKEEYDQQIQAYKQPIWTCQCSGLTGLTYEEALRSETEVHKRLSSKFPKHLERPVLQLVHHRAAPLDMIVDDALQRIQTVFGLDEVVELKVKVRGKVIRGKVVDSKEKSDDETTSFQYNVQVEGEDKIIHSIPGKDLLHTKALPSRDVLQLFIRASAVQAGRLPNSPWVVSEELVNKFELPSQINEVMLSPYKVMPSSLGNLTSIKRSAKPHQLASKPKKRKLMENNSSSSGPKLKQSTLLDFGKKDNIVLSVVLQRDQNVSNMQNTMATPPKRNPNIMTSPEKVDLDHSYSSPIPQEKLEPKTSPKRQKEKPSAKETEKVEKKTEKDEKKKEEKVPTSKKTSKSSGDKKQSSKLSKSKTQSKKTSNKKACKQDSEDEDVVVIDDETSKSPRSSRRNHGDSKDDNDVIIVDDVPAKSDKSSDESGKPDKKKIPTKRKLTDHFKTTPSRSPGRSPSKVSKKETSKGKSLKSPAKSRPATPSRKGTSPKRASSKTKEEESSSSSSSDSSSSSSESSSSDEEDDFQDEKKTKKQAAYKTKKQPAKEDAQKKQTKQPAKKKTSKASSQKGTPKKGTPKKAVEKEEESEGTPKRGRPKKTGTPSKATPKKTPVKKAATPKKSTPKKVSTPKKGMPKKTLKKETPKKTPKTAAGKKTPIKTPKSGKKPFKQATLFDVGAKKSGKKKSGKKDGIAVTKKSPWQPPIANKMCRIKTKEPEKYKKLVIKAARELTEIQIKNLEPEIRDLMMCRIKTKEPEKYKKLVIKAAKELTEMQIKNLKLEIREDVLLKYNKRMERIKWQSMSPEEREKIIKQWKEEQKKKKEEERQKKRAELKIQREEQAKRYEDQDIDLKSLPAPKLVSMPEGLPNTLFGDIAMVVEFLNCYSGLLMPDDPYPITADCLMKALVYGKEGFAYLARVLVILLKTLLQDEIAEDWKELSMKLADITVNLHTSSELLRMSLRRNDHEHAASDEKDEENSNYSDSSEEDDDDVPYELVEKLESIEFFELEPDEKLQLLVCVCHRITGSYAIQDFMEEKQKAATKLWREKVKTLKEKNDKLKEEKQKEKTQKEAERLEKEKLKEEKEENGENSSEEKKENGEAPTENKDDKKTEEKETKKGRPKKAAKKDAKTEGSRTNTPVEDEAFDLASVVKRRRVLASKMKEERAVQEKLDRERRIKEQEIYKKQREAELFQKGFEDGIQLAKQTLRQLPVGTDRNHSRYWVFSTVIPGLFIEKGWADKDVGYSTNQENGEVEEGGGKKQVEHTIPKVGQNLWFQYSSMKEINTLLEALNNQGIRESTLHVELKKRYEDITKLTFLSRRTADLRDSDGPKELLDSFREDMSDLELNIRQGQLGGVDNFEKWEKKLLASSKLKDLGALMIESYHHVNPKFIQGILAPPKTKPIEVIKLEDDDEDEGEDKEKTNESETISEKTQKWIDSVESAPTLSRLHVLLAVFETCIKWEKSTANARCKICRKKKDDNKLLLCDECNQPFHLFCLRPVLSAVPEGEWKCPACAPSERRASRGRSYFGMDESSEESSPDEEIENEKVCTVCEEDGELVPCRGCPASYHRECHDPPLKNYPRGKWKCSDCLNPSNSKRAKKANNARAKRAARRRQESEEEEDSEEESSLEEDSDFEETKRPARGRGRQPKRGRGRPPKKHKKEKSSDEEEEEEEESDEEEEEESEEEETKRPTRGRGRPAKRGKGRPAKKQKEESEEEEKESSEEEEEEESEEEESSEEEEEEETRPQRGRGKAGKPSKAKKKRKEVEFDSEVAEGIINKLMTYRGSVPFRTSPDRAEAPDYDEMIKIPMNLQMVKVKCGNNDYETYEDFFADVKLIFTNAHQYYDESNYIHKQATKLEDYFINQVKWANPDAVEIYKTLPDDNQEVTGNAAAASSTDDTESITDQRPTRRSSRR